MRGKRRPFEDECIIADEFFNSVGLEVKWLKHKKWRKLRGYDGVVDIPDVGLIRVGMGWLKRNNEMCVTMKKRVRFSCTRICMGVGVPWRAMILRRDHMWPGMCKCRGCKAKEWFDDKNSG